MRSVFIFLAFVFLYFTGSTQESSSNLARFIQQKGDSLYQAAKLPGLFVGVLNNGQRQYFSFGYAIPDKKLPFDSAMVFEAGSITKTFTAFIVEMVLQEKRIADTSSITSYLPDSVRTNKALAPITFLSLLNHTSGLPRLPTNMQPANQMAPYDDYKTADLFSYLKTAQPTPDGKSNYSNLGMGLAGVLAQRIAGKDYQQLVDDYILKPFAINASDGRSLYQKAQGHFDNNKSAYWKMASLAPAGGLQCTAEEMLNYLQYMIQPRGEEAKAVITKLLVPTASLSPTVRIGRGWHTLEGKDKPVVYWHNGGTFGFSTFAAFVRETGQAVVIVTNQFNSNAVSDGLGIGIMRRMLAN